MHPPSLSPKRAGKLTLSVESPPSHSLSKHSGVARSALSAQLSRCRFLINKMARMGKGSRRHQSHRRSQAFTHHAKHRFGMCRSPWGASHRTSDAASIVDEKIMLVCSVPRFWIGFSDCSETWPRRIYTTDSRQHGSKGVVSARSLLQKSTSKAPGRGQLTHMIASETSATGFP